MHAERGALHVRLGPHFGDVEAGRIRSAVVTFGPLSRLTVDFTRVRDLRDAAVAELARIVCALSAVEVVLRGLPGPALWAMEELGALKPGQRGDMRSAGHAADRRPSELARSIGAEGVVELHRNLFCVHYDRCLDEAVAGGWCSWSCARCTLFGDRPGASAAGRSRA